MSSATPGIGILRAPSFWNVDFTIGKRLATFGSHYVLIRGEFFNALNHPNFGPPQANIQSTTFGTITSTVNDARVVQLVVKYVFRPGGFAPPDPPSPSLAGAPCPAPLRRARPWRAWPVMRLARNEYSILIASRITG